MEHVNARKLVAACKCGALIHFVNLYITAEHELLTMGLCSNCDTPLKVYWPFEELIAHCPPPSEEELKKQKPLPKLLSAPSDHDFLHTMGISDESPS